MEKVKKSIDINEHITNIECKIESDTSGQKIASISFDNMGYGVITAVKFKAKGYNAFGDLIKIADKEEYLVIIQDLKVDKYKSVTNAVVKLPSQEIRKIELEECQICYDNGEVLTYEGKKEIKVELERFLEEGEEGKTLEALRRAYNSRITYNLFEAKNSWVCACGGFNKNENKICIKCGTLKSDTEYYLSEAGKEVAIQLNEKLKREETANFKNMNARKQEKQNSSLIVGICIFVIICVFITLDLIPSQTSSPSYSNNSYNSSYNTSSYESGALVLKVSNVSVTSNSSYTICTGTITNRGTKSYKFVKVKGAFKNSSGSVVDTDWTYAVGSEGLAPNESTTFRMSVDKNYNIRSCSVTVYDYD